MQGAKCGVQGARFKVLGVRFKLQGLRCNVQCARFRIQGAMCKDQYLRMKRVESENARSLLIAGAAWSREIFCPATSSTLAMWLAENCLLGTLQ